jgi:small conductance mechanosensitive channel
MTQPIDILNLTDHVTVFAGTLADLFRPVMIAQADSQPAAEQLAVPTELIPRILQKLHSVVDIQSLSDFALRHGPKVVSAIVVFVIGRLVARMASAMMVRAAKKARIDQTLMGFIGNVAYVLMLCMVCIASLSCLGVDTTSLTAVLAAAGFAIGMALQGTLGNFASGTLLVFFKPFRVGDFIDVGGVSGNVVEIQIFNTILKTPDNVRIIVPNSTLTGGTIRNLSAEPQRRIDLVIGTSYHDDLRAVRQFLESVVRSDNRILAEPEPLVAVSELGDSSVNFVVRPWVLTSNFHAVKFHLIEQIKLGFDERGFTIPFPSRDVFVHHSMGQTALPFIHDSSAAA